MTLRIIKPPKPGKMFVRWLLPAIYFSVAEQLQNLTFQSIKGYYWPTMNAGLCT